MLIDHNIALKESPWPKESPRWLWWLNRHLGYKDGPLFRYIGFCIAVTTLPAITLYYGFWTWVRPGYQSKYNFSILDQLLIAPIVETIGMALFLSLFTPHIPHKGALAVAVGIFAAVLHLHSQELGTHAFWGFYVYAIAFMSLRRRYSFSSASVAVCIIHSSYNLVAIGCGALEEYLGFPTS